jgi:hypothetical protein
MPWGAVAVDRIVAGRGEGSTLPLILWGQRPDQRLQAAAVAVVCAILADPPQRGGICVVVGDAGDALHTVGGKHDHRFGDEHRRGL